MRARLTVAGVVVLIGLVVMAAYTLMEIRTDAMNAHNERNKHLVEVSSGIVADIQKLEADKKMTREEAQAAAKEALRTPRFNTNDYYFLYDFDGRAVMVAGNPKMEGEVFIGKEDKKGFKMWDAIVAAGKSGSGYIDYWMDKPAANHSTESTSSLHSFDKWGIRATVAALVLSVVGIAWSGWEYARVQVREANKERFFQYHDLIYKISGGVGVDGGMLKATSQSAFIYELRAYPEYAQLSGRLLKDLAEQWERNSPSDPRNDVLQREIQDTLIALGDNSGLSKKNR